MRGISNYNKGESLATGFARPKVTALFFDKIWLPESLLDTTYDFAGIPKEIMIQEATELKLLRELISSGYLYSHYCKANVLYKSDDISFKNPTSTPFEKNISKTISYTNSLNNNYELYSNDRFLYSKNRNHAILLNTENFCRIHKIKIIPIFHSLTDFEKETAQIESEKIYGHDSFKFRVKIPNTSKNKNVLSICIEDFPDIVDDSLSWEQVLDIRKDKTRNEQLRKFLSWTERNFKNIPPEQIREILESEMEEYKETLRFFGIKTAIGAFSTIISSASSIVSILNNPEISLPLLSIASVSLNYASNTYMSYLENRKKPIAYLYNIENSIY